VRLFFLEAFFIGAIASLSGTLLGIGITVPLSLHGLDISKLSEGMSLEVSNVLYPRLNWKSTLLVFLYAVTVASLASLFPSLRATRIEPVEALRRV
jgi:ABC-type lipoprotein release transport system permease subunit